MNPPQIREARASKNDNNEGICAIVINFNGGDRVVKTVEALSHQQPPLDRILVVDNNSSDESNTRVATHFPDVEILQLDDNIGLSAARNAGLATIQSSRVLLIDNDLYLKQDGVARLAEAMDQTGAAVVCPRIRLYPDTDIVQADGAAAHFLGTMTLRHGYQPIQSLDADRAEVDGCIGACMLLDRTAVIEAGGFNELYFFYFEDLEFCIRMRALGHKFVCEPSAIIDHDRGEGTPGLSFRGLGQYPARRLYLSQRHRLLTIFTYYRLRTLILLLPLFVIYELPSLALTIKMRAPGTWFRAWWWQITNIGTIRRCRQLINSKRVRHDRDIFSGGPIPLAPGVVHSKPIQAMIDLLSMVMNGYWRLARPFIG